MKLIFKHGTGGFSYLEKPSFMDGVSPQLKVKIRFRYAQWSEPMVDFSNQC